MKKLFRVSAIIFAGIFMLASFNANALSQDGSSSLKAISPYYSVENAELKEFAKFMIEVYLLYGDLIKDEKEEPNFIFISGSDYLIEGAMNIDKVKKFFPVITKEEVEFYRGTSEVCLIFDMPLEKNVATVAVNDTSSWNKEDHFRCILNALAFFFDKKNYLEIGGQSIRGHARSIINKLEEKR